MMNNITHVITKEFYEKTLSRAIHEAGPKYTPGLEKDAPNLEIEELVFAFDILGRTRKIYEYLHSLAEELEKEGHLNYSISKISELKLGINKKHLQGLCKNIEALETSINSASERKALNDDIDFVGIRIVAKKCLDTIGDIESVLYIERNAVEPKDKDKIETINQLIYAFRTLEDLVRKIKDFCDRPHAMLANNPNLLLLGEAGIGKTHFLCDIAKKRIADGYPTIILLGHHFTQFTDPGNQITKILGLDIPFERLIQKLNRQAVKTKKRCLLVIDAINEGDKNAWRKTLNGFMKQIHPFKGVGLVISCRTPFEKITIPKRPKPDAIVLFHPGFGEIELDAQAAFFTYYKIQIPEVPLLTTEFSNPLFLKLFCKSLEEATVKKKHKQIKDIASGQKGMTYIFESFVRERGKHIEDSFSLSRGYCWNNVFKKIAEKMAESGREWISKEELKALLSIGKANAFINKLISEGMLHDTLEWEQGQKDPVEAIRFPYQKFSDHIIARYLLSNYLNISDKKTIKRSFDKEETLGSLFRKDGMIFEGSGIIEALMIEFPTRVRNKGELLDFLDLKDIPGALVETFINGMIWRDPASINDSTSRWVNRLLCHTHFKNRMMDTLVALAAKPKHPYNAIKLNRFLKDMKTTERDLFWSEFLRKQNNHNSIYRILLWIEMTRAQNIGGEYALMYATIMMWTLTSTNRSLRDRTTRAIYYIGCRFPETLFDLTIGALGINDPYISERMLAASYGAAMALQHESEFSATLLPAFGKKLYELIFKKGALFSTTHILMRDYAQRIIEIALLHHPDLLTPGERIRITPSFKDGGIRKWGKSKDKNDDEYREGNYPFGSDFDNYTVGRLIPDRDNYDFKHPEYISVKSNMWWRIYRLGYSLDKFGEIDKEIARSSYFGRSANGRKIDRYGKKYCWIAWHEIAGYRQDEGLLQREWYCEYERFTVDIDPSFPDEIQKIEIIKTDYLGKRTTDLSEWIDKGPTPDLSPYLIIDKIQGEKGPWVLLDGYISQEDLEAKRGIFIFPRGLLVKDKDFNDVVECLKKQNLGGRWLPEIPADNYTFAGEIPWCETSIHNGEDELIFSIDGEKHNKKIYKIFLPIHSFGWESHHSIINPGQNAYVLSKEMCEALELSSRPQTFDLYDKDNRRVSITLKWGGEWDTVHKLIYIRQDLLGKYLKDKGLDLIWATWGERHYKSKNNEGLMEFSKKHKPYKVFQKIITLRSKCK